MRRLGLVRGRLAGPWALVSSALLALVLVHCGNGSEGSGPASTAGAGAGSSGAGTGNDSGGVGATPSGGAGGGVSGGTGGTAGTSSAGGTGISRETCIAYNTAVCERRRACGSEKDSCPTATDESQCPEIYSAPGVQRSEAQLLACAEEWAVHPCAELDLGSVPDCVTAGTLADGEPCIWNAQCASLACRRSDFSPEYSEYSSCGTCLHVFTAEEDCVTGDGMCPLGQTCNEDTQRCEPIPPRDATVGQPGQACTRLCEGSAFCLAATPSAESGTCIEPPGASTPCGWRPNFDVAFCADGLACAEGTCQAPPASGPCLVDYEGAYHCGAGSFCSEALQCEPLPGAGTACGMDVDGDNACALEAYCQTSAVEPTCTQRPAVGEPCVRAIASMAGQWVEAQNAPAAHCGEGLVCDCADAACTSGTCVVEAEFGEACDAANTRCPLGGECAGGICTASEGGVFAALCGQ